MGSWRASPIWRRGAATTYDQPRSPGGELKLSIDKTTRVNTRIRVREVRLIEGDGSQAGIVTIEDALRRAQEQGLDLVEVAPAAAPPVCRIMDFGKFKFEAQKKAAAAKKKQKTVEIKELKFRPTTDDGDYNIKLRNLRRFLEEGDKVKVNIRFKGREMAHQELGLQMAARIEADLADEVVIEQRARLEGRQMIMMMSPKKK
jgi:translation initiation factor IF-3